MTTQISNNEIHCLPMSAISISVVEATSSAAVKRFVEVDAKTRSYFLFFLLLSFSLKLAKVTAVEVIITQQQGQTSPGRDFGRDLFEGGEPTECANAFLPESEEEPLKRKRMSQSASDCLLHVDFEVDGIVQGVFFRKYTQKEANKLGLRGFCRNTSAGTVTGSIEGSRQAIEKMKHWLRHTGSPMSRIEDAVFKNEKQIDAFTFSPGFDIARTV